VVVVVECKAEVGNFVVVVEVGMIVVPAVVAVVVVGHPIHHLLCACA
jgi:hypothetical protein